MAVDVQISMNVLEELTAVVRPALTPLVAMCVPAALAIDWEVINEHAWVSPL